MGYVVKRDILIPAGTVLDYAPSQTVRCDVNGNPAITSGKPPYFVEAIIGPTADTVFSWVMHIDDALEADLIEEAV